MWHLYSAWFDGDISFVSSNVQLETQLKVLEQVCVCFHKGSHHEVYNCRSIRFLLLQRRTLFCKEGSVLFGKLCADRNSPSTLGKDPLLQNQRKHLPLRTENLMMNVSPRQRTFNSIWDLWLEFSKNSGMRWRLKNTHHVKWFLKTTSCLAKRLRIQWPKEKMKRKHREQYWIKNAFIWMARWSLSTRFKSCGVNVLQGTV